MGITPLHALDSFERAFYIESNPFKAVIHPAVPGRISGSSFPSSPTFPAPRRLSLAHVFSRRSTLRQEVATLEEFWDR